MGRSAGPRAVCLTHASVAVLLADVLSGKDEILLLRSINNDWYSNMTLLRHPGTGVHAWNGAGHQSHGMLHAESTNAVAVHT